MKRLNNLHPQVYSIENLMLADKKARKGKLRQYGVKLFDKNREAYFLQLHKMLKNKTYKTSAYTTFTINDPKEREVFRLPYFPDRITHHAVMNIMENIFTSVFTADTYSCIKGRGIHGAHKKIKKVLRDVPGTQYCLKLDIKKFYPNIDHDILKKLLRRKIKDQDLLWLLDEIIDSAPGLPIGNYLSQYFANFYLAYFDHWIKEEKRVRYFFRYADDLVIFGSTKEELHQLLHDMRIYLHEQLKLSIKDNYQIFPVHARGVDFIGYVYKHTHVRLRKNIKKSFARMIARNNNPASIASYYGWAVHANCSNLLKKLLNDPTKIRRPRYKTRNKNIHRRQNQNGPNTGQNNLCPCIQN
jgi:RNA-directed DNA polymerase